MAADLLCPYMAADLLCPYMAADLLCPYMAGRAKHPEKLCLQAAVASDESGGSVARKARASTLQCRAR
jgi:hypothetical protein